MKRIVQALRQKGAVNLANAILSQATSSMSKQLEQSFKALEEAKRNNEKVRHAAIDRILLLASKKDLESLIKKWPVLESLNFRELNRYSNAALGELLDAIEKAK